MLTARHSQTPPSQATTQAGTVTAGPGDAGDSESFKLPLQCQWFKFFKFPTKKIFRLGICQS